MMKPFSDKENYRRQIESRKEDDVQRLRVELTAARDEAERARQANLDSMAHYEDARDEAERLRGRVAELESVIPDHIIRAHQRAEVCWDAFNHLDSAMKSPMVHCFLLRKQADAVEASAIKLEDSNARLELVFEVDRLRAQADELEAGGTHE